MCIGTLKANGHLGDEAILLHRGQCVYNIPRKRGIEMNEMLLIYAKVTRPGPVIEAANGQCNMSLQRRAPCSASERRFGYQWLIPRLCHVT